MKHLEIIHLRLTGPLPSGLLEEIERSVTSAAESVSVSIYSRVGVESDIAIHLHKKRAKEGKVVSDIGLRIASALREYSMVEHTLWRCATNSTQDLDGEDNGNH